MVASVPSRSLCCYTGLGFGKRKRHPRGFAATIGDVVQRCGGKIASCSIVGLDQTSLKWLEWHLAVGKSRTLEFLAEGAESSHCSLALPSEPHLRAKDGLIASKHSEELAHLP